MRTYIIGIGQCGTSIAFDIISSLAGFDTKSKKVASSPQRDEIEEATNELVVRLNRDYSRTDRWLQPLRRLVERIVGSDSARKVFILPKIAIIDGNPNNFIKDAFSQFRGGLPDFSEKDTEAGAERKVLASLISSTKVLSLGNWNDGCGYGIVGETVTSRELEPCAIKTALGVDDTGRFLDGEEKKLPIRVYLVVSSAAGGTGSGGAVYMSKSDMSKSDAIVGTHSDGPLVLSALVLPSVRSSENNPRYAMNAGRALARYANVITASDHQRTVDDTSVLLFSNPSDEGNPNALQMLNDYIAEFSIRLSNFAFLGDITRYARDLDPSELTSFLSRKTAAIAMSSLANSSEWEKLDIEKELVRRAFKDIYLESEERPAGLSPTGPSIESPTGLSIERELNVGPSEKPLNALSGVTGAIIALGVPPSFRSPINIARIEGFLKENLDGARIPAGIRTYSYGSPSKLEMTVLLRYRRLSDSPLTQHYIGRYVDLAGIDLESSILSETDYLKRRADGDDDDVEVFEEVVSELERLGVSDSFDKYVISSP